METTNDRSLRELKESIQIPYLKVAALIVFAVVSFLGGRWLHFLGYTQHAHLYMPPFIVAGDITDMGKVFHYAGSSTWLMGGIYLVKTIVVWLAEAFTSTF